MSIPNVRELCMEHWQPIALYGGLFAFLAALLAYRLGTLLHGYSPAAVQGYQDGASLHLILQHPLNLPFSLLALGITKLHVHNALLVLRGATAALGFGVLVMFCALLRHWHDRRTALFGTLLLGTSSWFLAIARGGTPSILLFGLFGLIACGVWLRATGNPIAVLLGLVLAAVLVYTPGMIWLIGLGIVWQWKAIDRAFKEHLGVVTLAGFLFVGVLVPLALSIYHHPDTFKPFLNFPAEGWPAPFTALHHLLLVPLRIFVHGQSDGATILSQLPMLNVFDGMMFLLGGYLYLRHIGLHRSRLFMAIFLGGAVVASLGGSTDIGLLLPFLYLVIAVGVAYMLDRWFAVFPRNPIAQGVGLAVMGSVIALACAYHLRLYYVAWPQSAATQVLYSLPDPSSK